MERLSDILPCAAGQFASQTALIDPKGNSLSYELLAKICQRLAKALAAKGIGPTDRMAILSPKSNDAVIAILSVLATEAAYIPIDAHAPLKRNAYILADSGVKAVIATPEWASDLQSVSGWATDATELPEIDLLFLPADTPPAGSADFPHDLAYMLYTSGSTGLPKGVLITHRNALAFIEWSARQFAINETDVLTSIAPFHFDLSIFDLYASLLSGASLLLIDQKAAKNPMLMAQWIGEYKVSVVYATPTLLKLMLHYGKLDRYDHSRLRTVLFAGEVFPLPAFEKLRVHWPSVDFYNLYGPTETNVVTWQKVPATLPSDWQAIPIGRACPFADCRLWEEGGFLPSQVGQRGELVVSGDSVAAGYLHLPEKTETSFLHMDGRIWYRTGDLVEQLGTEAFLFIGRKDRMVKRRGYRIELAEVERSLRLHPSIQEVAVFSGMDPKAGLRLKACIQLKAGAEKMSLLDIKTYCSEHLPQYMLPDSFIFIEHLPKTSSHKIDYQKLKEINNA